MGEVAAHALARAAYRAGTRASRATRVDEQLERTGAAAEPPPTVRR